MDEVRALLSGQPKIYKSPRVHEKDKVTVDRTHYDSLLVRLGQLEANQQLLLEYKEGLQTKERELSETKATLAANTEKLAGAKSALNANSAELAEARATITKARSELQNLLQIKKDAEQKAKMVLDQQTALEVREKELETLRAENERLKRSWWRRLFLK